MLRSRSSNMTLIVSTRRCRGGTAVMTTAADSIRVSNHVQSDQHTHTMLLKKQHAKSTRQPPSTYVPITQAFTTLSNEERGKLRVNFDISHFVVREAWRASMLVINNCVLRTCNQWRKMAFGDWVICVIAPSFTMWLRGIHVTYVSMLFSDKFSSLKGVCSLSQNSAWTWRWLLLYTFHTPPSNPRKWQKTCTKHSWSKWLIQNTFVF